MRVWDPEFRDMHRTPYCIYQSMFKYICTNNLHVSTQFINQFVMNKSNSNNNASSFGS